MHIKRFFENAISKPLHIHMENKIETTTPTNHDQATLPVAEVPVTPQLPVKRVAEGARIVHAPTLTITPQVDRSAYNCPDCGGEGLVNNNTERCPKCGGTGKI